MLLSTANARFEGPDCGIDGCAREVGHIGEHHNPDARPLDPIVETWALEVPARLDMQAARELRQQLQAQLPGKRVVVVTEGARFRALESLDAAWAEVEDALPISPSTGTAFITSGGVGLSLTRGDGVYWAAWGEHEVNRPTPAAALRALAAKLREAHP